MIKWFVFCIFVFELGCSNAQSNVYTRPTSSITAVNDFAGCLTPLQKQTLEYRLRKIYDSTTHEIVVITLDTLFHNSIAEAALAYGKAWKIGSKEKNNGIILMLSEVPRKVRIELGLGFATKISNERCKLILNDITIPKLKNGDFFQAFDDTINELDKIFKTINL